MEMMPQELFELHTKQPRLGLIAQDPAGAANVPRDTQPR
jgi:hypothetical protein